MAAMTGYWKIIRPKSNQERYASVDTPTIDMSAIQPSTPLTGQYSSETEWYSRLMRGPASRVNSYIQYESMDADVDINRGLDIIAEEMTPTDEQTQLPFLIDWETEDNADISDATVVTVRAALRAFCKLQDVQKRKFGIARHLAKFGDAIFRKTSDTKKWKYINPSRVVAIEVDEDDVALYYHIRVDQTLNNTSQSFTSNLGTGYDYSMQSTLEVEKIPASAIIHFTNCDDMSDTAPFGVSLLKPIYRVFRQYTMLEDAIVIYKVVRAPERRVFYIDVGNMNPTQVKRYLENLKNEMRQKRAPNLMGNGREMVDGQYDPTSIQEDFFFPVTAGGKGSKVETIPGGSEDFGSNLLRQFQSKMFRGLRIPMSYAGDIGGATENQPQTMNDGKVGVAYFEELRFANFVIRQQQYLNTIFDREFKNYLTACDINIEQELFRIKLPPPDNFALYKQAAVDAELINGFGNMKDVNFISKRMLLRRYLGWTDDEIQMNEVLLKEEINIRESDKIPPLQQLYDPAVFDNRKAIVKKNSKAGKDNSGDDGEGDDGDFGGGDFGGGELSPDTGGSISDTGGTESEPAPETDTSGKEPT